MEIAEKAANQCQVEMLGRQRAAPAGLLCGKGDELRQIALVRRHCVGGQVAIQADVVEKVAELFQRSRSSSARSDVASLRSARPSRFPVRAGGGSMMPNVMLVGW